jgi:hypothetical protein
MHESKQIPERSLGLRVRNEALRRFGARIGISLYTWQMLETIRRPEWLYRSNGLLPRGALYFREPRPVSAADVGLCERLIAAYLAARQLSTEETGGMWSTIFTSHQRRLWEALERGDPAVLATLLSSMFRADFMFGIAPGSLVAESESRIGARIWWLKGLDGLFSLAEALGVSGVENPEQGIPGRALAEVGVDGVVAKIETNLGFSVDFPDVGAPYGILAGGQLLTLESPEQIYAAERLKRAIGLHLSQESVARSRIVEIGAGYGGMAYWFLCMQKTVERYTIVDLPIMNVVQGYFLSQALGPDAVSFFGESPAQVTIVPNSALASVAAPYDVLVNKDSMPEMPERAMLDYLVWARSSCDGIFFSYNQEAAALFDGVTQSLVPEAVERVGGFTRIRRDASWLRRGYVEEIYVRERERATVDA